MKQKVKRLLKFAIPYGLVIASRKYRTRSFSSHCTVCEQNGEFLPMTSTGGTRQRAVCPSCGSLERHRLVWLFITRKIGLENLKGKSMLHIAAESMFESKLRKAVGKGYLTADYLVKADVKMDITNIKYKDSSFDIIMCNHVLEHVSDDRKAMREMHRVLKPGGWAIFLVPLADMKKTYENSKVTTTEGRLEHFGQEDHVRKYGRDYIDRLQDAGWKVEGFKAEDIAGNKEIVRSKLVEDAKLWGFTPTEIFYCSK